MKTQNNLLFLDAKFKNRNVVLVFTILSALLFTAHNISAGDKNVHAATWKDNETDNEVIIAWNRLAYTIANEHDQFYSFTGVRALAMTHIAIHDALNAITPEYEQYAFKGHEPGAGKIAAVSQAAYEVLLSVYPKRKDTLNKELQKWLGAITESKEKTTGILLGKKSSTAILQLRKNDGHDLNGKFMPADKPGYYQITPGFTNVWIPDLMRIKPFALRSVSQFRSLPPPTLNSAAYAVAYNEVKDYGCINSEVRTKDQTCYAHWWAEFGEHSWNRIGRLTAKEKNLSLLESARMFAFINMDLFDIYLASFDSKYAYNFWRPYTAIHLAEKDGNPGTKADTRWLPEMQTPPWPDYPSAHSAVGAGGAEIVSCIFGTPDISFKMESISALPEARIRSYVNIDSAANECANSRIMNGYHFRFSTEAGKRQGRNIAKYVCSNYLRPLDHSN